MAGNSDGSIIIDTELDSSGFDKGSQKLLSAVENLTDAVDNLGDNMMRSFQTIIPILQQIGDVAARSHSSIAEQQENIKTVSDGVADAVTRTADAMSEQQSTIDSSSNSFRILSKEVVDLNKESNSFASVMDKLSASLRNGFSTGASVIKFKDQLDKADAKALEFERHLNEFGDTDVPTEDYQWLTTELERARKSLNQLIERQGKMRDLGVKESSKQWQTLSYNIAQAKAQIGEYEGEMAAMRSDGTAFVRGSDTAVYEQMKGQLEQARSVLEQNKALIDAESISQAQLNVQIAQEAVTAAKTTAERQQALDRLRAAQTNLNSLAAQSSAKAKPPEAAAVSGWQKFKTIMASVGKTALRTASAVAKVSLKTLAAGAKASYTAIKALGKGLKSLIGFLGKSITKMKAFNKQSRNMGRYGSGLASIFSNFKMMLGFTLISTSISAITKEISESIGMLARFSDEFDTAISNIMNSVKALAGNITVTFSNLIIAVEPVITQIIDKVSEAFTYLNALFSMLQGKSTVTVAKKQTDSYAESLEDAAESAEELKNQVYGFDELNKRSSSDESEKEEEKLPEDLYEEVPVNSLIPEELLDTINKIKEAIQNGDWYGLGQMAAEGLNNLLRTIDDWINNVLRPKGVEWAQNIAEFLNGFVDAFDWTLLGKTIADGLNAIADIINTFLTTFNFENLGNGFGEAINSFFGNVEWDLIGQTFANGFNALIDFIFGLVNTIDWSLIGDSFTEFFNNFFFTVDWDKGAQAITTGLNGIVEAFQHFLDGVDWNAVGETVGGVADSLVNGTDWEGLGEVIGTALNSVVSVISSSITSIDWANLGASVANGFNSLFNTVNWTAIAEGINAAISGVFDTVNSFLEQMDWTQLGSHLGNFIDALDAESWLADFGTFVSNLITSALDLAIGFIEEIDWGGLTDALWNGIGGMIQNVDWSGIVNRAFELLGAAIGAAVSVVATLGLDIWNLLKEAWESVKAYFTEYIDQFGGDIIAGLWEGIKNAFVNAGTWIKENIFQPFIDGFKSAFGIHSPSTEMQTMGQYIIEGLLAGITETWGTITGFFEESISALKETLSQKWNEIKESVSETFSNLKESLAETAETISTNLSKAWDNIKSATSEKWSEIKEGASKKFTEAKNELSKTGDQIKSSVSKVWENIKSDTSQKWNNITSTLSSSWDKMKSTASSKFNDLKNTVSQKWNDLKNTLQRTDWSSVGSNLVSGLQRGISNMWSSLTSTVSSLARSVTNTLSSVFKINSPSKVWEEIGEYLDEGLINGIKGGAKSILATTSNLAKSVNGSMSLEAPEIAATQTTMSGIDVLTDRFGAFIDSLRGVTDMLSSVGTLYVPPVAAGTVVPYKIRPKLVDSPDALTWLPESLQAGMNDQTEIMSEVMYLLGQILEVIKKFNLKIDANSLVGVISYLQRNNERDFGGV